MQAARHVWIARHGTLDGAKEAFMKSLSTIVPHDLTTTRERFTAALAEQGFGIRTEVDFQATFEAKLGETHEPHVVLGICNPGYAKRALDVDRSIALLLPCSATLRGIEGGTEVLILDPEHAFALLDDETQEHVGDVAAEVKVRLGAALETLA